MRAMFYEFPEDPMCWEIEDAYMYGDRLLAAPVLEAGAKMRQVYLPKGCCWKECEGCKEYEGGQMVEADAPLERMPLFLRLCR